MHRLHTLLHDRHAWYREWHAPDYRSVHHWVVFGLVVANVAASFVTTFSVPFLSFAEMSPVVTPPSVAAEVVSNELLVQVKESVKDTVKENAHDTGVASLTHTFKSEKVVAVDKITSSEDANAKTDAWYKIALDAPSVPTAVKVNPTTGELMATHAVSRELQQTIHAIASDPSVEKVEPNYIVKMSAVPNDSYYATNKSWGQNYEDLWGLKRVNAEVAWDTTTGSPAVIVANVDTGVDRNHEDLKDNMWVNADEIPGNGRDDDHNGYSDDYYGWDWVNNDTDPMDDNGHGTHTAGITSARGNNSIGMAGVNWVGQIMALKFMGPDGVGKLSDAISALRYAADNGAKISSNSWVCECHSSFLNDALTYEYSKGMIIVAAAGNSNQDVAGFSPAAHERVIAVGALAPDNTKADFSNWGSKIEVMAPGVDILSAKSAVGTICPAYATVGGNYCRLSGTSMAAPYVSGLAALLWTKEPTLSVEAVRDRIRSRTIDLGEGGKDNYFGYGAIDVGNTLVGVAQAARSQSVAVPVAPPVPAPIPDPPAPPQEPQIVERVAPPLRLRALSKKEQRTKRLLESQLASANRSRVRIEQRIIQVERQLSVASAPRKRILLRTHEQLQKQRKTAQANQQKIQTRLHQLLYY